MEVYIDDMLVKSIKAADHIIELQETFNALRRHRIRLNLTKCAFGVSSGKFLSFLVTNRGIEANPEKIKAIIDMRYPTTKKKMQQLTGRIAALRRFISRSAEKCLPFFKVLRQGKDFEWNDRCRQSFDELKHYLISSPLLSKPLEGETMYLYLSASPEAVSSVLVRKANGNLQHPVYYTSKILWDAETRYSRAEKLIFALVTTVQRLRPYFQAYIIKVLTDQPLKAILQQPDTSGRMAKWAIKLSEFDIVYRP